MRFLAVFLATVALLLALESVRERRASAVLHEQVAQTLDSVVSRIRQAEDNRKSAIAMTDAANLAKARVWARLVEADPSYLTDQDRMKGVCHLLETDEVCVTDSRGVLIASEPKENCGFDLSSAAQSAVFMPAVTNRAFELAQKPQPRGINHDLFQYAGVARRDQPGIVQVGISGKRLAENWSIANPEDIARTARVRRGGFVTISPLGESLEHQRAADGRPLCTLSAVYGDKRVTVAMPTSNELLAGDLTFVCFIAAAALLFLVIILDRLPVLRHVTAAQLRAVALVIGAGVSVVLAFSSVSGRTNVEAAREQLLLTLENVMARVRASTEGAHEAVELTKRANLAKARAFQLLATSDPTLLKDRRRLEDACHALDADELSYTDAAGVIVEAWPTDEIGYRLTSDPRSAAFMPAITNKTFALSQDTFQRTDGKRWQYACVARMDKPGVLCVGFDAKRLGQMQALAGVDDIVKSTDGSGAFVSISPEGQNVSVGRKGYVTALHKDERYLCLSDFCEGRQVTVGVRDPEGPLDGRLASMLLVGLAAVLFLCVWGVYAPEFVVAIGAYLRTLGAFFVGLHASPGERARVRSFRSAVGMLGNPVVIVCAVAFLFSLGIVLVVQSNEVERRSRQDICQQVRGAISDITGSVDNMLFAIARAMVRHYRTPNSVSYEAATELVDRYDVDEVTVVNSNGVITVTNFGNIDWAMTNGVESGKFNCLLHGVQTYAQPFRGAVEDPEVVRKYAGVPFKEEPGYIQIGIDRKRLTRDLRYLFRDQVREQVGEGEGFLVWTDGRTGEIIANGAPEARPEDSLASIGFNAVTASEAGVPFDADFYGKRCMVVWMPFAHLRLYVVLPYSALSAGRNILVACGILLVVFALFALFAVRLSSLVTRLKTFIAVERDRQKSDMAMAKTIQLSSLPFAFPNEPDYRIFASMDTAREVGGDFYDFYERSDGKIVFVVADVSGKGVPAALFMMRAKAILRAAVFERPNSISGAVMRANDNLAEHNEAEMFVTAWVGVYDRTTGEIAYVNAGHNPPLIRRADGTVEWVRGRGGLVLAAMGGMKYKSGRCRLGKGDSICLYTDGVTEAMNTSNEQYGETRLEACLKRSGTAFIAEISKDITQFTTGAEQSDDITMLALDRLA